MRQLQLQFAALVVALSACGACGARAPSAPQSYEWDRRADALVAAHHDFPGHMTPHRLIYFQSQPYGYEFVRLMGDGTLYYGTPVGVHRRRLDEQQMQDLLRVVRPDRFATYDQYYRAEQGVADANSVELLVDVIDHAPGRVAVYALNDDHLRQGSSRVPEGLLVAAAALRDAAHGGEPFAPQKVRLLADPREPTTGTAPWPVADIDLFAADADFDTDGLELTDRATVDAVVALLGGPEATLWSTPPVYAQDGKDYAVGFAVQLP